MPEQWNKDRSPQPPTPKEASAFVGNPLWDEICAYLEETYQVQPVWEYSRCSQPGWNAKYRKAGRSLCTLYPLEGGLIALVVIGERERTETELLLPFLTEYTQTLYRDTKYGMGQRWLMMAVAGPEILEDVKKLIAIRRGGGSDRENRRIAGARGVRIT